MKNSLFNTKEYLITAAFNLVCLILYFLPALSLGGLVDVSLGEMSDKLDMPVLGFLGIVYIILAIAGIVTAVLPAVKEKASVQAIPDIKDGLFVNLQGAPMVHVLLIFCWFVYAKAETGGLLSVGFCFTGILALLVGIAGTVWYIMMSSRYKKNKQAQKKTTTPNA